MESLTELLDVTKYRLSEAPDRKEGIIWLILEAKSKCFHIEHDGTNSIEKKDMVRSLFSLLLNSFTVDTYKSLMGGSLVDNTKDGLNKNYNKVLKQLKRGHLLNFGLHEYVSNFFGIDIFLIYNSPRKGIYFDVGKTHHKYYHKERNAIILYVDSNEHKCSISLVYAMDEHGNYSCFFGPDNTIIP